MRIKVELEDGDRFLFPIQDASQHNSIEVLVRKMKDSQNLILEEDFILFLCPPLQIVTQRDQINQNYEKVFYLYHRETLRKLIKQMEGDIIQQNSIFMQIDLTEIPLQLPPVVIQKRRKYDFFEEVQKLRQAKKKADYNSKFNEWDDEIMQQFVVDNAKSGLDIIRSLKSITTKIGFQLKVGDESQKNEAKYVKLECAYPLKHCPFYLLYEINEERCIAFACHMTHSHDMGPIPLPPI